jgi:aminomethyltransferase
MSDLRRTPLYAAHREGGAKLVDFAGWEMPLHYGSQIDEHHAVRRAAGMFDVSHMLAIDLDGAGTRAYLRRALANDVDKLAAAGGALYACMLNESGGVLDDLIVYYLGGERFRLVVNAGTAERDLEWLEAWRSRIAATVTMRARRDLAMIAIQGPLARERLWQARTDLRSTSEPLAAFQAAETDGVFIARTGYTGEDGFEIMLPAAGALDLWYSLRAAAVTPAGLGARDTLRLEAGMNLYGQDMDEATTPLECGLAWTVDFSGQRDFIGRRGLAPQPARRQLGVVLLERGVMRRGQTVRTAGGEGMITSGGFAPTLNRSIGLARVPSSAGPGAAAQVEVRGKWLAARTVKPPFVRRGRALVSA